MNTILITGAGGEVGHGLIEYYSEKGTQIVALDQRAIDPALAAKCLAAVQCDITDAAGVQRLGEQYRFDAIFHLAAILSSGGERNPIKAQEVNINGSFNLLVMAREQAERHNFTPIFVFPSSIAAYGVPSLAEKTKFGSVTEDACLNPITIYGMNKLGVEHLGRYFTRHYQLLAPQITKKIDFRCVRFPGLVSPDTLPTGGTSDYFSEMIHAAAEGKPYSSFVREDATLPFMAMSDAILALVKLAAAPQEKLSRLVYNVTSFTISAAEIAVEVRKNFPQFQVTFAPHAQRQQIVDSWPADMNDAAARRDWGWAPKLSREQTFRDYLIPRISARYSRTASSTCSAGGADVMSSHKCANC